MENKVKSKRQQSDECRHNSGQQNMKKSKHWDGPRVYLKQLVGLSNSMTNVINKGKFAPLLHLQYGERFGFFKL